MAVCVAGLGNKLSAQEWAIKSNLLYDATTTINLGIEKTIAPKWTFDLSGNYNPFQFSDNMKWKHWLVQPEFRWWTCREFSGHFLAAHLVGGLTTLVISTVCPISWETTSLSWLIIASRVGLLARAWVTVTRGCSASTGISRPRLPSVLHILTSTNITAPSAARRLAPTITSTLDLPRRLSVWFTSSKI